MAALEVIALDTSVPQLMAPQAGDTYTFPRAVEMPLGTANGVMYLDGSKVVTSGSALTFDGTTQALAAASGYGFYRVSGASGGYLETYNSSGTRIGSFGSENGGDMYLGTRVNNPMIFLQNGSEQMRLTSTGLGIGTSSPEQKLDVYGASGTIRSAVRSGTSFLSTFTSSVLADGSGIFVNAGSPLSFAHANTSSGSGYTERMRLDSSGNLGIGTSSPAYKLDVLIGAGSGSLFRAGQSGVSNGYTITSNGSALTHFWATTGEAMRLDASGNLGLGVTPSAWSTSGLIDFSGNGVVGGSSSGLSTNGFWAGCNWYYGSGAYRYKTTNSAGMYIVGGTEHRWYTAPSGNAGDPITFTQAMTLDASGNLAIGTTTFAYAIAGRGLVELNGSSTALIALKTSDTARGYFAASTSITELAASGASQPLVFTANGSERARITSGGDLLVGTLSTILSSKFASVAGASQNGGAFQTTAAINTYTAIAGARDGNDGNVAEWWYDLSTQVGTISVTSTATAYNTSSDYRLKNNPQPLTNSGAFIDALQPKTWEWKTDGSRGVGFIAHEVQAVSPGSVTGTKDAVDADGKPIMQAMEYGSAEFIANIIAELQSLRARLAAAGI